MQMRMQLRLVQRQLQSSGGATSSIFPEVDQMLNDTDCQEALRFIAKRKKMDRYNSMVDFLFCEIYVGYQYHCWRFYEGKGQLLKDMTTTTPEKIVAWEKVLVAALKRAMKALQDERHVTWTGFVSEVLAEAA